MRPRMGILALVMALMLMSMVGMSAIAQDATPQGGEAPEKVNGIDCGRNVPLFDPDALPRPKGVNTVFACAYFATGDNASGGLAIIGTLLTIEPGLVIENPVEGINIRQTGTANITIIQGSLAVGLVATCAEKPDCGEGTGIARYSRTNAENQSVWTDLVVGDAPTELLPGDLLIVENVTVTYTAGEEGTLVASSGDYNPGPGQGCNGRCFQFP